VVDAALHHLREWDIAASSHRALLGVPRYIGGGLSGLSSFPEDRSSGHVPKHRTAGCVVRWSLAHWPFVGTAVSRW
jgi:hypothetical protein